MDQLALQNINILMNMNEKTSFILKNKEIVIEDNENNITDEYVNTDNNLNDEYTLYFTFNQLFNIIRSDNINRRDLINNMNSAFNNLYDNEHFLKLLDTNENIEQMFNDIDEKLDFINERYPNNLCNRIIDNFHLYWDYLISEFAKNIPKKYNHIDPEMIFDDADETDDDTDDDDDEKVNCIPIVNDNFTDVLKKED